MRQLYLCFAILLLSAGTTFAQVNFTISGNYCIGAELTFNGPAADTWNWNFNDGSATISVQNPHHSYQDSGIYVVSLSCTTAGITSLVSKTIHISLNPIAGFIVDSASVFYSSYTRLFIDTSVFYNVADKFDWDFGNSKKATSDTTIYQHKYTAAGTYLVWHKVTDIQNCADSVSQVVTINDRYFVPNVFTPNDDTYNDKFIVTSNGITLFSIDIFSRWGNLVFRRSGVEQIVWDGKLPNGTKVKPGTYYYVITSQSGQVTYEPQAGFITVIY